MSDKEDKEDKAENEPVEEMQEEEQEVIEKVVKKKRAPISEELKKKRLENLARGRAKRKAMLEEAKKNGTPLPKKEKKKKPNLDLPVKADLSVIEELKEDNSNVTIAANLEELKNEMRELKKDKNLDNKENVEALKTQIQELKLALKNANKKPKQEPKPEAKPKQERPKPKVVSQNLVRGSIWAKFKN